MHSNTVYAILKKILSNLTGKHISEIYSDQNLKDDLNFSPGGLYTLNVDINEGFFEEGYLIFPPLHGDETSAAEIVRHLRELISKRFSDKYYILKNILSNLTEKHISEINSDQKLIDDLNFTPERLNSLNVDINEGFAEEGYPIVPPLRGDETDATEKVIDLKELISSRFNDE